LGFSDGDSRNRRSLLDEFVNFGIETQPLTLLPGNWINYSVHQFLLPSFSSLPSVESNSSFKD